MFVAALIAQVAIIEDQLQHKNREMSMVKMKSMFFVMIILFGVFGLLNNLCVAFRCVALAYNEAWDVGCDFLPEYCVFGK